MPDKNTFEAAEYIRANERRLSRAVWQLERWAEEGMMNGIRIYKVTIAMPGEQRDDYLATLKGRDETGQLFVAWVGGATLAELHNNIAHKGATEGFKWRDDKPLER